MKPADQQSDGYTTLPESIRERWTDSQMADKIGPAILCLGRLVRRRIEAALEAAGLGLTPAQAKAIVMLHLHGPLAQQALAYHAEVEPSTMVSTLDVLEREGLARREPNPGDRRSHLVQLTPAGDAMVPRLFALWTEVEAGLGAGMSEAERRSALEFLHRLIGGLMAGEDGACAPPDAT